MTIRQLRDGLRRLKWHGWTWEQIGKACGKSDTWACLVTRAKYDPPGYVVVEVGERLEKTMSVLPYHRWETTEELETQVLEEIQANHIGRKNAIKMPLLAQIVGCSERKARAAISSLRDRGYPLCTSIGDPPGAFWPENDTEFWRFIQRAFRPRWRSMKHTEEKMIEGFARLKQGQPIEVEMQPELI